MSAPRRTPLLLAALVLTGLSTAVPPAAAGEEAWDYAATPGLSQPEHPTTKETFRVPLHDGATMYVEVTRPTTAGRFPVILELSPYHATARDGATTMPWPNSAEEGSQGLTRYFAPRGYAVAIADLRGTGRSSGCLDHLGPNDAKDAETIIEWLATRPWSNGRVGMAGFSYVAASQTVAAAQRPEGLVTIVPNAGLASMYHHQFQAGVPYYLQWAAPVAYYEADSLTRDLPPIPGSNLTGDNFGNEPQYVGCGLPNSSLTSPGDSQLSGEYTSWHGKRDHEEDAEDAPIPIFLAHGINDGAARIEAAEWFFERDMRRYGDKLWLGPWDHGLQDARYMQWTYALHAWFDHHLQQRTWVDAAGVRRPIDTGPPVEVFLADSPVLEPARSGVARTEVYQADRWPDPTRTVRLFAAGNESLSATPPAAASAAFTGDPRDIQTSTSLTPKDYDEATEATGHVEFISPPTTAETFYLGRPRLDLVASVSIPRVHLIATLYDQAPGGERRRVSTCAINPELRHGVAAPEPVVPVLPMDLRPPCFRMAHVLDPGHRLVLRVTTSNKDKIPFFGADPRVTVHLGERGTRLALPVVDGASFAEDDVPLGRQPVAPPE